MADLISESITPRAGTANAARMGLGEPGLPAGFVWRDQDYDIVETLDAWKQSSREGARAVGESYLRRHYYRLKMSDGSVWTVYFLRQSMSSSRGRQRWFLYTVEPA